MHHPAFLPRTFCLFLCLFLAACSSVPLDRPKEESFALQDTQETRAAQNSENWRAANPELNGVYPLTGGKDAFGVRLALADGAERSIDVQYFLMKPDHAGLVFIDRLMDAADRGVRVRFLLDDIFTTVDDSALTFINDHPNIELRIFNPISRKGLSTLNYVGTFKLANRRMHNKSFIIDNEIAVVGGRNIAVEYFQLETTGEFIDFDMLAAGPVVKEVSASFDEYWNHELAVPMEYLREREDEETQKENRAKMKAEMAESGESTYAEVTNTELMQRMVRQEVDPFLAEATMIVDEPSKLLNPIDEEFQIVAREVGQVLAAAQKEIIIYTPYLIPGDRGKDLLADLSRRGVRVIIVTNSLATNNHTPVHAAYTRHRRDLLNAGVELWEARADAAKISAPDGTTQLDKLTLHTKGMIIDQRYTFVGSLNLDPRSIDINTEMGLLIDSTELGERLSSGSHASIPGMAYRVLMDQDGKLSWHATIDGEQVVETTEPQTNSWDRFKGWFMKIAPESQL